MRFLLISPRTPAISTHPEIREVLDGIPELSWLRHNWHGIAQGLLIVAALTCDKHEVSFVDENWELIDYSDDADAVILSIITYTAPRAYKIADRFRAQGKKVVIGGIHATAMPGEVGHHADAVAVGEAEVLWPEILRDLERGTLRAVYRATRLADLRSESPVPAYHLLEANRYPIMWVQSTRGCPHDCVFCAASAVYGRKYRRKSVEQVIAAVSSIREHHGSARVGFADDNMLADADFALQLLPRLTQLGVRWYGLTDVSLGKKPELIPHLRRSGCVNVFIGLQSVSAGSLNGIDANNWKARQLPAYSDAVRTIQDAGIGVMGAFVVGFDGDDKRVFHDIAAFAINNNLQTTEVTILTPLPGTRLRDRLIRERRLLNKGWEHYGFLDVTFRHPVLTEEDIIQGLLSVYQRVYCREVYLKKMTYFKEVQRSFLRKERE